MVHLPAVAGCLFGLSPMLLGECEGDDEDAGLVFQGSKATRVSEGMDGGIVQGSAKGGGLGGVRRAEGVAPNEPKPARRR